MAAQEYDSGTTSFHSLPSLPVGRVDQTVLRVLCMDSDAPSACVLMLAIAGKLPPLDLAVFVEADEGPGRPLADLARIQQVAIEAGIPVLRLTTQGSSVEAVREKIWELLGNPTVVPDHVVAELVFGVCLDDIHKAIEPDVPYLRYVFPLLDWGWSRRDCESYLRSLRLDRSGAERWRRGWAL